MGAQPETFIIQVSSNYSNDSLMLDYKIVEKVSMVNINGKLDEDGRASVTLPVGVKVSTCSINFQGSNTGGTGIKPGVNYMLPGGRYMFCIKLV